MRIVTLFLIIIMLSSGVALGSLGLKLTKTCNESDADYLEDVSYSYSIQNIGNETLHGLKLTDSRLGNISLPQTKLTEGNFINVSVPHTINATDMPGPLRNSAVATALGPKPLSNPVTSNTAYWSLSVGFSGNIKVKKECLNSLSSIKVGSIVTSQITVTNPRSNGVAFRNVSITEDILYSPYPVVNKSIPLDKSFLSPGETATALYNYTVKHDDIQGPPDRHSPVGQFDLSSKVWAEGYPTWLGSKSVTGFASLEVPASYISKQVATKFAIPSEGGINSEITFKIFVNNTGDTLLNRTELWDLLPVGLDYFSSNPDAFSSPNVNGTTTLYWSNLSQTQGILLVGGKYEVEVKAKVNGSRLGGLRNRVTSKSYNLRNESVTSKDNIQIFARKQDIRVVKTCDISSGTPGAVVNFTLTIKNTGNITLKNVFVSDILPQGMSYLSSSPRTFINPPYINWSDIGSMLPGASRQLWIKASINGPISGTKTLTNRVNVEGKPESGSNVTNNDTAIVKASEPKINITKTADPTFGSPSTNVNFTLVVNNTGCILLPHVFVSDLLPAGLSYVSSSMGSTHSGQTVSWSDIGPLGLGERKRLWIVAHIDGPISGIQIRTNRVDVEGKPEHGNNVTNNTTTTIEVRESKITVTKTADPTFGSPSTNFNFTLVVKNTGSALLPHVFVSDLLPAGMSYVSSSMGSTHSGQTVSWSDIGPLRSGERKLLWIVAHIDGPVSGIRPLTNRVDVEGKPEHGNNVTNNTTTTVEVREPRITVTKTADPSFGSPSTNVNFTLVVNNTGSTLLPHVFVSDLLPTGMSYVSSSMGSTQSGQTVSWSDIGPLSSGDSKVLWIVAHIDGPVSGIRTLTNRVDVQGQPEHGQNVTNSSTADVRVQESNIMVQKTANPSFGSPSTNVNFTLVVNNTGSTLLPHVFVRDLLPTGMSYVSSSIGSTQSGQTVSWSDIGPLSSGDSKVLWIVAHIDGPISGIRTLTNRVDVQGQPEHGQNVTNSSTADVRVQESNIMVQKTANPSFGSPSTNVNFTLVVNNTGSTLLPHVFVRDLLPAGMSYVSSSIGSTQSGQTVSWSDIGPLSSGDSKVLWIVAHIDGPVSGIRTLTNRVDVQGQPEHGNNVTNNTTTTVEVREPRITVTKTANPTFGSPSTNVNFTLLVKNTGSALLPHVFVRDLLPEGMSYVSSSMGSTQSGQTVSWRDIGPLGSGAGKVLWIVAHIDGPISGIRTLTNRVGVEGQPEHGQNVTNRSTANVRAQEANIIVTKAADPTFGSPSTNVNFTLLVKNSGSSLLPHVFVRDLLPEGMSYVSSSMGSTQSGQTVSWSDIGPLGSSAGKVLWMVAHIDGPISGIRTLTNRVDVEGQPEHGQNVTNSSTANVRAEEANILVTKIADPTFGSPGTNVNFTLLVRNSGSAPLPHVFVRDLLPAGMSYVSSSLGSTIRGQTVSWSDIGPLGSGSGKVLWMVAHIDGPISGIQTLTNRVDVEGKPEHGQNVTNRSTANVRAQEANIIVTKAADPTFGSPSTNVNFTLLVKNSGSSLLPHVFVSDLLPAGMSYVSSSTGSTQSGQTVSWRDIGPLGSGAGKVLWIVAHIDGPISGIRTLTNRVGVEGQPEHGQNVTNRSTADVKAESANIMVSKTANPTLGTESTFINFTLNVTNNGAAMLGNVFVSDKLPSGLTYDSSSAGSVNSGRYVNWTEIGPMPAGDMKSLWIKAKIDGTVYGTLTNLVSVTGKPQNGDPVTNSTWKDVTALKLSISGRKFNDLDGDGTHEGDPDPGLAGWTIELVNLTSGRVVRSTITNESGLYQMDNVIRGKYIVREVQQSGWRQTCPVQGNYSITVDHSDLKEMDFANQKILASINVTKVANPTVASPGANISFEINILNNGKVHLGHVHAVDTLPVGMSYISDNRNASVSGLGRVISWNDLDDLDPGASTAIHLVARIDRNISGRLIDVVYVNAIDPEGGELNDSAWAEVRSLLPKIKVSKEPLQYGQYCEAKTLSGVGIIESTTSIKDKTIALDYDDTLTGEGEIEMESAQVMSEAAGKLQRDVPSLDPENQSSLNLFADSKLAFKGAKPLTGGKSIHSMAFYGGSGARIKDIFSAEEMEKEQTSYFSSTDNASSPQTIGTDLKSSFNGTIETDSKMHNMFGQDIKSQQLFSGVFNLDKVIKFHKNATADEPKMICDGIDC